MQIEEKVDLLKGHSHHGDEHEYEPGQVPIVPQLELVLHDRIASQALPDPRVLRHIVVVVVDKIFIIYLCCGFTS